MKEFRLARQKVLLTLNVSHLLDNDSIDSMNSSLKTILYYVPQGFGHLYAYMLN